MILTIVYKYIQSSGIDYRIDKYSNIIFNAIKTGFTKGDFEKTNASTTRPTIIRSTSNLIVEIIKKEISL